MSEPAIVPRPMPTGVPPGGYRKSDHPEKHDSAVRAFALDAITAVAMVPVLALLVVTIVVLWFVDVWSEPWP